MTESYEPLIHSMPNGLRVIAVHRPWSKSFATSLMYRVGSFDDPTGVPGAAHFAEHLAFAGENKELVARIAGFGTQVNARTGYDHTEFTTAGHVDGLGLSLEFVSNTLQNRVVTDDDIVSERDVFFHELEDDEEQSQREIELNAFFRRAIGDPNWYVSQTKRSVKTKRFTPNILNAFKQQFYSPSNASLAIVSPIACGELRRRLDQCLARESATAPARQTWQQGRKSKTPSVTVSWDRHAYIWVDVMHSLPATDRTLRLTAKLISRRLGGGPHSEMFKRFRSERGIAYQVYADCRRSLSWTAMHCFFSVPKRSLYEALAFAIDRLHAIATCGISESQLEAERQRMIRWHEIGLDHPRGLASYLAYEALRPGQADDFEPDNYRRFATTLTLADINDAAAKLLLEQNRATFVGGRIGPIHRMCIKRRLAGR
jgi:zinc protease